MKQNTVFGRSSCQNLRTKESKFSRELQVVLLLAVSIWLLYQIMHPHEKPRGHATILMGRKGDVGFLIGAVIDSDGSDSGDEEREDGARVESDFNRIHVKEPIKIEEDNAGSKGKKEDEKVSSNWEEEDDSRKGEERTELSDEVADQGNVGSSFDAFHDENGVPPDSFDLLNSISNELMQDEQATTL